jgi:gliding motility-associated-like protein
VTVLDTIAPTVVCQAITLTLGPDGTVVLDAVQLDGGSQDNCGVAAYSADITTFQSPGTYEVALTVTDVSGNSSTCTATVTVGSDEPTEPFVIPSGFSPNGDGIGDTWVIRGLDADAQVGVVIFNRWGDEVYSSADYHNDWDGHCTKGVGPTGALPDGTYFYVVELNGGERTEKGYLQIAR